MRGSITILYIYFQALILCGTTSSGDDQRWLSSLVDLVELDYEDHCSRSATATLSEMVNSKELLHKLERDKTFGIFSREQAYDVRGALTEHALNDDDILRRKVRLILHPGDTLLETSQWIKLVTFGDTALNKLRFATDYDCGTNTSCTLRELQRSLARQHNEEELLRMKQSWEKNLPDPNEYLDQILPLLRNASKENGYNSLEEYWDALGEYEGAILKARELWDNIRPLYLKLHKYVSLRLKGSDAVGKPLPVHVLRSLTGDDWSNVIESLLPKHPDIYQKVHVNLQLKNLGGAKAFHEASKLLKDLNLGEIDARVLSESMFNGTCPTTIINWCEPNKLLSIVTCKDISIGNYMEAHEAVMKIKYKQTAALHSNNTYILREANRYSAVYEAIPGFASLLAMNPHALNRTGLYPIERFIYNPNHHRLVLQLITALQDLPKLNFYLAADEWRLKTLMDKISPTKLANSWTDFRRNFSLLETSNMDFLGEPYMVLNKPYIGKFMGLILKYQIYQSFAEELVSDEADLIERIAESNDRLVDAMMQGFSVTWPELVSDLLAKRENEIEYTGLTDYYRLLDDYLDNQLDPSYEINEVDDYVEPVSEPPLEENEIIDARDSDTHENIINNIIDTGDETNLKFGTETSTVGVLEIKNPVAAGDQESGTVIKEASYNTYWWIGIAVAIAIVVILIAIIARKRQNHRKELERQRRENSHA